MGATSGADITYSSGEPGVTPLSLLFTLFVTGFVRRVPLVEEILPTLQENLV
jgi:hypothetical protein